MQLLKLRVQLQHLFETFPFPADDTGLTPELTDRIRHLAEQLDTHRKARQAAFETVTLTGLYNVLEKLRHGEPLTAKDKLIHELGLVSVLKSLHDELDAAALAAYGFVATLQEESNFGRVLAAYGGIFVAGSLVWGIALDGFQPDRWDYTGATICLIGVAVIMFAPRPA